MYRHHKYIYSELVSKEAGTDIVQFKGYHILCLMIKMGDAPCVLILTFE
jgi:hypothetical protein